jgi:hypothetical protein
MATRRVTLKASYVAAIIGKNRYKPRSEVFDEMWKKLSPGTFTGATRTDLAFQALRVSDEARKVLDEATSIKTKDSTETVAVFEEAKGRINSDPKLSEAQKSEIISHLQTQVYTSHGTRSEDKTSDKVEVDTGAKLIRDNSFYSYHVCTIDDVSYSVVGKIDRIEERPDGSRTLVEIKNRTRGLFNKVYDYEMIQIQTYLQMLDLEDARLVEQYNAQVNSMPVKRDRDMWDNVIVPGLKAFCEELHAVVKQ